LTIVIASYVINADWMLKGRSQKSNPNDDSNKNYWNKSRCHSWTTKSADFTMNNKAGSK